MNCTGQRLGFALGTTDGDHKQEKKQENKHRAGIPISCLGVIREISPSGDFQMTCQRPFMFLGVRRLKCKPKQTVYKILELCC